MNRTTLPTAGTGPGTTPAPDAADDRALTWLVRAMLVDLALGLVVAATTWLGHDAVVAHQLAHTTGQSEESLSVTLWSRPAPSLVVALLYPLFIRRLRRRERRGWRRTVVLSVVQVLGLGWYAVGTGYPWWLSVVVGLQALAALVVLGLALRPAVRRQFPAPPADPQRPALRRAVLGLVVVAPLVAELSWGSTRASQIVGLALYWPAYAAGALLVRELVRRAGGGWPSVLVLGVAYGLVEEGVCLQSLTSPSIFPSMVALAPRVAGVNVAFALMVLTYHAVLSVGAPIALAELLAPQVRHRPWLRRPGLVVTGVVAVLGFGLLRLIPLTADPHYLAPWYVPVTCGVLVVVLALVALRVLPRLRPAHPLAPPAPVVVGATTGLVALVFLGLVMPLVGTTQAGWMPTPGTAWIAVGLAAVALVVAVGVGARWAADPGWRDAHLVRALTGLLLAHTVIGLLSLVHRPLDIAFLALVGVVEAVLLVLLVRRVDARALS